jgi:hypothetical protein
MKQCANERSLLLKRKRSGLFYNCFAFFLLSILLFVPFQESHGAQITLTWDPNNEPDLAGYEIYFGTASGNYQWNIDVGNATTYTLTGLNMGTIYYAAATAYNTNGYESGYSNEVSFYTGACTYTISPSNASFAATGGSGSVSVTTQPGCNWGTSESIPWLTVISGSGTGSGTMTYTISPNTGILRSASLTIAGNVYTVTEAGLPTYTITASAGAGGSISPSGQVSVLVGASQSFSITPNTGYQITDVTVDGVSQGAISSYYFSSISANHTITASFASSTSTTYTLSINKSGSGSGNVSVNPQGTIFSSGTPITLTAVPEANSTFSSWSGGCSGTTPTCQVVMNSNVSVTATFLLSGQTPVVTTGAAASLTFSSATLNGTVNPHGFPTTYIFEWGTTISYGHTTSVQSAGNSTNNVPVTADIIGLTANALYHFRLVATNSDGTTNGTDGTFIAQPSGKVDFNHDGKTDLLWRNKIKGDVAVWYMDGATLISGTGIYQGIPLEWESAGTGDYNSDGKTDILWRNKVNGNVAVWYMDGANLINGAGIYQGIPLEWEIAGTGDYNSDGKADILWRNKANGDVAVWYMDGANLISGAGIYQGIPLEWEIAGTGDYNSDGKADILWRNKANGNVAVWYMDGVNLISGVAIYAGVPLEWVIVAP